MGGPLLVLLILLAVLSRTSYSYIFTKTALGSKTTVLAPSLASTTSPFMTRFGKTKTLPTPDWLKNEKERSLSSSSTIPASVDLAPPQQQQQQGEKREELLTEEEHELRYLLRRCEDMKNDPYPLSVDTLEDMFRPSGAERLKVREEEEEGSDDSETETSYHHIFLLTPFARH
jgi:hypothetical protein